MASVVRLDTVEDPLWPLFQAVVSNGDGAWAELAAALEGLLVTMARQQPIGRLRGHEDTPREIVTRVLARLHHNDFDAIRKVCALSPRPDVKAWLRVLVKRSAIDYMRASPEFERGNLERQHRWISLATLSSRELAAPDTLAEKRAELLAFMRDALDHANTVVHAHDADEAITRLEQAWNIDRVHVRRLIARADRYARVLTAVFEGWSYPEIATRLGITRREVELTVRYIEDFLEARGFADPPP